MADRRGSGYEAAFEALAGLTNYETMARPPYGGRAMNLPRTRRLLAALDRPDRAFPCLQVAGTKGKGTASFALARMLEGGGYRVGLYTSPHLFSPRERIRVGSRWISEEDFAEGVRAVLPHVEPLRGTPLCPTFFELMTVLALHHFRGERVDAAVLEVGLGGRLDATSAVRPLASLLTTIGLDHTALLGPTRASIAREKAGVAKRGVPLLSGVPAGTPAGRVIARIARARGAPLHLPGRDYRVRCGRPLFTPGEGAATPFSLRTAAGDRLRARPAVLGRDLARDAALAAALLLLPRVRDRFPLPVSGLEASLEGFSVPGRIQVVRTSPPLVVDGAHNPDSARSLLRAVREALPHRRAAVVVGGAGDRPLAGIARILARPGPGTRFLFTRPARHPRAADPRVLARTLSGSRCVPDLPGALAAAERLRPRPDLVLVTGSLYLAGEALEFLGAGG